MHITDIANDTGSSAPEWMEMKRSARKCRQQSWSDGQMFVLVPMEKKAQCLHDQGQRVD